MANLSSAENSRLPEAICWHEGMLLAPQHFQQSALRFESLLHYHLTSLAPYYWGVQHCDLDEALLLGGVFRVLQLRAIMPDGLVVSVGEVDEEVLEIDLKPSLDELSAGPQTIWLSVPLERVGAQREEARFLSIESGPYRDEISGDGEIRIPRLRPNPRLRLQQNPPARSTSFPIARVQYINDRYELTDFLPPTLQLEAGSPLLLACRSLLLRLRDRALFIAEEIKTRYYDMGMEAVLERRLMLRSLVEALPEAEALVASSMPHPFGLYLSLCAIAGKLATLSSSMLPPSFPAYDHNDLERSFRRVYDYIISTLDEGLWDAYFIVPFHLIGNRFEVRFQEEWKNCRFRIGIRGAENATEREVASWMEEALIASSTMIGSIRDRRVLGVARERSTDQEIFAIARGMLLFTLDAHSEYLVPGDPLHVVDVLDRGDLQRPAELLLFVYREKADAPAPARPRQERPGAERPIR